MAGNKKNYGSWDNSAIKVVKKPTSKAKKSKKK